MEGAGGEDFLFPGWLLAEPQEVFLGVVKAPAPCSVPAWLCGLGTGEVEGNYLPHVSQSIISHMCPSPNNLTLRVIADVGEVQCKTALCVEGGGPINSRKEHVAWGWVGVRGVVASPWMSSEKPSPLTLSPSMSALSPSRGCRETGCHTPGECSSSPSSLALLFFFF